MESAKLTTAHALLSEASRSPSSVERHHAVANEFAKTAESTTDSEALRVLRLLEQEHRRLACLVEQRTDPRRAKDAALDESTVEAASSAPSQPLHSPVPATKPERGQSDAPIKRQSSPSIERRPAKPLSSSIANNLASARGIPTVQQRHSRASSSGRPRSGLLSEAKAGATTASSDASAAGRSSKPPSPGASMRMPSSAEDDGFNRFYANFEGLWSRLSAPLAFAGLPLIPETTTAPPTSTNEKEVEEKRPPVSNARHQEGPDLNSIYSRAALKAIRDEHGGMGVHESFFVVPTTGGVKAMSRDDEDDDEFEDARESVSQTASPRLSRQTSRVQQPPQGNMRGSRTGKTMEELETENASLKQLTDTLSKRLYTWEKNAQHQTMQLQQSIRSLHPLHQHAPDAVDDSPRIKELEEQLRQAKQEIDRGGREIDKLQTVVGRYRERWEKLKEGARSRRETGTGAASNDAG